MKVTIKVTQTDIEISEYLLKNNIKNTLNYTITLTILSLQKHFKTNLSCQIANNDGNYDYVNFNGKIMCTVEISTIDRVKAYNLPITFTVTVPETQEL